MLEFCYGHDPVRPEQRQKTPGPEAPGSWWIRHLVRGYALDNCDPDHNLYLARAMKTRWRHPGCHSIALCRSYSGLSKTPQFSAEPDTTWPGIRQGHRVSPPSTGRRTGRAGAGPSTVAATVDHLSSWTGTDSV
jgi:hypothetical protein